MPILTIFYTCNEMEIVFWIFIGSAAIVLLYYLLIFSRLNWVKPISRLPEQLPPVSVIICAHNEAENLKRFLKVVLIQQYPVFEVILVNDRSTDNTIEVIVDYYKRNTNVKVLNIAPDEPVKYAGKKEALLRALDIAAYDTIVLTDADCRPASTHWLVKMVASYMSGTQIVLGYSPYEKSPGILNKLIRYETFITALQYLGFARVGMPYMGVGRNLSYRKNVVADYKGFDKYASLPTGDDDLLINAMAKRGSTEICVDKDAFTYTLAEENFKDWLGQKRRHLRSGFHYRWSHQFILFLFALSGLLFYFTFLVLLSTMWMMKIVVSVFAVTLIVKLASVFMVYQKLQVNDLKWWSPVLDVFYTVYLLMVFFLILLKPKKDWT